MAGMSVYYVLIAIYAVPTAIFLVMENRRPQATFAWMLLFFAFPGFGVVIYLLFGRDRKAFSRQRKLIRQHMLDTIESLLAPLRPQHETALDELEVQAGVSARLAKLVRQNSHSALTIQNEVEVLQDAAETYPRLIGDIEQARSSIHLQFFSWASDDFGRKLKTILARKAEQGVEVRILYDPVGSFFMLSPFYVRAMNRAGIRMAPYSPIWRLHTIGYRNHRKIAVIDGTVGYTGGLNIGREHIHAGSGFRVWRDTHVRIAGAAASVLQSAFAVDWQNAVGEQLLVQRHFPMPKEKPPRKVPVQITLSGPDSEWQAIRQLYFKMIVTANRHVYIQSPFFILDDSMAEAIKAAALSGIDVRIMLSERGLNQFVPYWAANTYIAQVVAAGAKVYMYRRGYLHAKTISVDSKACSIGSANIDIRSFSINYELNAVIYDPAVAKKLEADFLRDLEGCVPFEVKEYRRRNWLLRFRDSVARLFSPLL